VKIDKDARRHLAKLSDGDARKCLNALEIGVLTTPTVAGVGDPVGFRTRKQPSNAGVADPGTAISDRGHSVIHSRSLLPRKASSRKQWCTIAPAMRTTIRLAPSLKACALRRNKPRCIGREMLHAGEDFRFIARRIVIFASEDIGLADPEALPLAIATQQAVEFVGLPEARIPLAHATAYMCRAPKSRKGVRRLMPARKDRKRNKPIVSRASHTPCGSSARGTCKRSHAQEGCALRAGRQIPLPVASRLLVAALLDLQAQCLRSQNHDPPRDKTEVFTGVQHFREPIHRGLFLRARMLLMKALIVS